jgi:hypothetical protein
MYLHTHSEKKSFSHALPLGQNGFVNEAQIAQAMELIN